jgi:two-component system OmpR family sensor kinase
LLVSEKKSLFRFLAIYLASTFLLFSLASWIFYTFTKHQILDQQNETIKYEAQHIKLKLRELHKSDSKKLIYPKSNFVESAIYDLDGVYIFGTQNIKLDDMGGSDSISYILPIEPYYLGAAFLKVKKDINQKPINNLQKNIVLFMFGAGIFFSILGYFLGKLFIAPMRESIKQMNHFIQDTTHELNTPISTILTNIEMIEALELYSENPKELKRIEIASKTLSRIYDDLTYLNLNHDYHRNIEDIDMSKLLSERIVYFEALSKAKSITIKIDIKDEVRLQIDKNDAIRVIDNLLSNAIKYNKVGGNIDISLSKKELIVEDNGVGIKESEIKSVKKRFKRANKSEGGFGIGLDIVNQVVKNYGFKQEIRSKENIGTKVMIIW